MARVPPSSSRHLPLLGITLKLASVAVFAGMTVCVKFLGRDIPSGQTIFVRGVISVVVLALIAWGTEGLHLLKTSNWRRHACALGTTSTVLSTRIADLLTRPTFRSCM